MSRQFKVTYEWQEGEHQRSREAIIESETELTLGSPQVLAAIKQGAAQKDQQPPAAINVISIEPYP